MAWYPISHSVLQYDNASSVLYSGAVLKAYAAGTSTPIYMAIDSAGATQVGSIALNANGNPTVSGNVIIPYVSQKFKLMLYPTQAAADANSGELWSVDNIPIFGDFGSVTQFISTTTALDSSDLFNHIEASGDITITLPSIATVAAGFVFTARNAGTGTITWDGDSADTINGAANTLFAPGDNGLFISNTTGWAVLLSRPSYANKGTDIASATTTNIWASAGELNHITGTTTITSFGTANRAGEIRELIFDDAVTLTHNASTLVIPGGANYTTAAGDVIIVRADTTTKHLISAKPAAGGVIGKISSTDGLLTQTGASAYVGRTITAASNKVTITNGSGVSGNPTVDVNEANFSLTTASGVVTAWVNFQGTGTVTIRKSLGVSSVSDNGTGDYTVNFSITFPDANYAFTTNAEPRTASDYYLGVVATNTSQAYLSKTTTSIQINTATANGGVADMFDVNVLFVGR